MALGAPETGPVTQTTSTGWGTGWGSAGAYFHPIAPGETPGVPSGTPGAQGTAGGSSGGAGGTPVPYTPGSGFVPADGSVNIPSAYASARQVLTDYGLESLLPWFMTQIKGGATPDELLLNMRQTPEFKAQFPEIGAMQANGQPPVSVTDILNYRQTAAQLAHQAGLPPGFLDQATVSDLMVKGVSASELSNRVVNGIGAMLSADPNVKQYFGDTFGANGPGALTAWFLNADKAEPLLEQQVRQAQIGGSSKDFGFDINPDTVAGLAAQGVTQAQADSGFSQMSKIASLFNTLPSETGGIAPQGTAPVGGGAQAVDATTGAQALIGKDASALDAVTQKLDARQAAAAGKVGIEEDQTHGFRGLGTSL